MLFSRRPRTVQDFIDRLKLDPSDTQRLNEHIQYHYYAGIGPGFGDRCDSHFRDYLKANLPSKGPEGLSWNGRNKLSDALNEGFSSKQAFKMGIPAIGIVAVLVANVAFVAWIQTPGGSNPTWQGCNYPYFTAFLIVNGAAFMLAVASAVVVTAFPLVLSRTPHQAAWWGGILLMLAMLAFIVAFLLAGFVTVGYNAPPVTCSSLQCSQGGIECSSAFNAYANANGLYNNTVFVMDSTLSSLNSISSNSSSFAVCVTYDRGVPNGPNSSIIYPWVPLPTNFTDDGKAKPSSDLTLILTDATVQRQTICMDAAGFPDAIDQSTLDPYTLAVEVPVTVQGDVGAYLIREDKTIWDILPTGNYRNLYAMSSLTYFCQWADPSTSMQFNVMCAATTMGNYSVSTGGSYIRPSTEGDGGVVLFDIDATAMQVSHAIQALAGVFSVICLVIIAFLVKSKWF